ncbi:MAG: hypothetical protein HY864_13925 [Chloroflexi bacterium]|nr:hypothetical protein [Chloroflexota bacterium]
MTKPKKIFLFVFALFAVALNISLYIWNQSLKASEIPYLVNTHVDRIAFDGRGQVWVYGDGKLSVYKDGALVQVFTKKDSPALGGNLWELEVDNKGRTWVATQGYERTVDLAVFNGTKWSTVFPLSDSVNSERALGIYALAIDAQGRAWVGVEEQGLYIINGDIWKHYTADNSDLLSNTVDTIVFDNQGRAWLGTQGGGLNIFDGEVWQTFTNKNSPLLGVLVGAIAFDHQGQAWIASTGQASGGINIFDGETWVSYPGDGDFLDIDIDGRGRVWAMRGFDQGIVVFDGKTKKYFFDPFHLSVGQIGGMLTADENGNIWIPTENGVVIILPDSPQPISFAASILSIIVTTNGLIYLTTLLMVIWLCVAVNVWRSIGFSLLGLPIYLGWIIMHNQRLSQFDFSLFNTYFFINPGVVGTIAGIIGGCLDIFLAKRGSDKRTRWGLVGLVIGSGLSFCFMVVANMAQ